jgi:hypothetical protein
MPDHRLLYADLLTGSIIGELPLSSAEFGAVLNGPGAFRGRVGLRRRARRTALRVDDLPPAGPAVTPSVRAFTTATTGSPSLAITVGIPASAQVGDLLVFTAAVAANTAVPASGPAGWTWTTVTTTALHFSYATRWAQIGDAGSTVTLDWTSSGNTSHAAVSVVAVKDATSIANAATAFQGTATTPMLAPSVTAAEDYSLLLCAWGIDNNATAPTGTVPGGMTEHLDLGAASRPGLVVGSEALTSAGSTGARSMTPSLAEQFGSVSLAITGTPPPPGGETVTVWEEEDPSSLHNLEPGRVALYLERDGVVVWSGPLWTLDVDLVAGTADIGAEGWLSYWRRRRVRSTLTYTATDQATIATGLLAHAQAQTQGDIGFLTSSVLATGRLRDRIYLAEERGNIGTLLEQLAAVQDGFEFAFEVVRTGTAYERHFRLRYPVSDAMSFPVPVEVGGQAAKVERIMVDATSLASSVEARGEGSGEDQLRTIREDLSNPAVALMEDEVQADGVSELATLEDHGDRRLRLGYAPALLPSIVLDGSSVVRLGDFSVGDGLYLYGTVPSLWTVAPPPPPAGGIRAVPANYKITEWSASLSPEGAEVVRLTVAPMELFRA